MEVSIQLPTEQTKNHNNGPFPIELLVNIFIYLDGPSLSNCSQVCSQWNMVISQFDHEIWPFACKRDFESFHTRRFWSLQFPEPLENQTWQDMYRITRNWYTGRLVHGFYPQIVETVVEGEKKRACAVIGTPQEQGMFTNLTLSHDGRVVRSNPNYHRPSGPSSLMIQSPQTKQRFFLDQQQQQSVTQINAMVDNPTQQQQQHSVVCHYTHPNSKWLVTGGLNGTVAIWDLTTKSLVRMWPGHRGRVLCISMNNQVVVSGGSDSMIRVWDLDKDHPTRRRGMIDISSYLSSQSDWYQGVGEIAVNGNLVACAPDASGPILVFSLLTGSLVYELREHQELAQRNEWVTEDITAFTRLLLTPFFLLTKGKVHHPAAATATGSVIEALKLIPSDDNIVIQRTQKQTANPIGYVTKLSETTSNLGHVAQMTPYQLYQYYQSINHEHGQEEEPIRMPTSSACINVWNLKTGKIVYRLLPTLETPHQNYTITDVRTMPDYSKVFASIEVRGQKQYQERLYCWDFTGCSFSKQEQEQQDFDVVELDSLDPVLRKNGKSWVCFM